MSAPSPSGRPVKRSVLIAGHRTSVSLEAPFWDGLKVLADARGLTVAQLIAEIDAARVETGLSGALRVAVLEFYRGMADGDRV
ncbi:MAG: ribbon-helix-helix domain-containing protein [Methyloligellaceae bacterium]